MSATGEIAGKNLGVESHRKSFPAHCPHCRQETLFLRARVAHRRHLLLILLTGGLWTVVWLALLLGKTLRPWRCGVCGWHKPEFREAIPPPAP